MRIRISLPENRDHAGRLEVLDESGAVVFGPVPAAGRAHDEPAAAHGNASRSPLRAYGDTPLGSYAVRGVLESGPATGLDPEVFGSHGVVLLEPASGQAALADAHGRLRLFIQGGGDDGDLRATAGAVRLHDRDQKQLVALVRRASGRVLCEVVSTAERGAKVSLAEPPLDRDPPALPGRSYVATQLPARSLSRALASIPGARAASYAPRMFVVLEHSGSSGGTAYGGGGDGGEGGGGGSGGDIGLGDAGTGPTDTGVGPLPVTGTDVAPTPGADLNAPPDDAVVTGMGSGADRLLSMATPTGLPDSPVDGGWIVGPVPVDPYTNAVAAGGPQDPFVGQNVDPYMGTALGGSNAFTGGPSVDPFSGFTNAVYYAPDSGGPGFVNVVDDGGSNGPVAAGGGSPGSPSMEGARIVDATDLMDPNDGHNALYGQQPIDRVNIGGTDFAHYQVNIGGTTYDAYVNDMELPDKVILLPAATQSTAAAPAGGASPASPSAATTLLSGTPPTGAPSAGAPPPDFLSQSYPPGGLASTTLNGPSAAAYAQAFPGSVLQQDQGQGLSSLPGPLVAGNAAVTRTFPPGYQFVASPTTQAFQLQALELPSLDTVVRASGNPRPAYGSPVATHVFVDPNPLELGFTAKNPGSTATSADHALGNLERVITETHDGVQYQYVVQDSPFIATSGNVEAAAFGEYAFEGERYLINLEALGPGTTVIRNDAVIQSVQDYVTANPNAAYRAGQYISQQGVEQEIFIKDVPPEAVTPLSDARTMLRAEVEVAPSAASTVLSDVANAGLGVLKVLGEALTVYGAYNMASRNADEFRDYPIQQAEVFVGTFLWGIAAGAVDDAFAAATVEMGSAPVLDSWDRFGAGPTQVLVGDVLQSFYRWAAKF